MSKAGDPVDAGLALLAHLPGTASRRHKDALVRSDANNPAMRTSWVVVAALAILVVLQPALLFIAAHFRITSSFQSSAELASVMGAIFTAGGLIVALVSLYSLANVDKIVQDGVAVALKSIPHEVDERIRTFLDAYTPFREAQFLWTNYRFKALGRIEELVVIAERIEPTLRNLRRWSGTVFFESTRASYLRERTGDGTYADAPLASARSALIVKALQRLEPEFPAAVGAADCVELR